MAKKKKPRLAERPEPLLEELVHSDPQVLMDLMLAISSLYAAKKGQTVAHVLALLASQAANDPEQARLVDLQADAVLRKYGY